MPCYRGTPTTSPTLVGRMLVLRTNSPQQQFGGVVPCRCRIVLHRSGSGPGTRRGRRGGRRPYSCRCSPRTRCNRPPSARIATAARERGWVAADQLQRPQDRPRLPSAPATRCATASSTADTWSRPLSPGRQQAGLSTGANGYTDRPSSHDRGSPAPGGDESPQKSAAPSRSARRTVSHEAP
jgi:hypothetical protein